MNSSPEERLVFEGPYEIIEYLTRIIGHSEANKMTSLRLQEAHEYCQKYLMPDAWGKNVWHSILDDAIKMRKALEE